jgi:hypothetical protein
LGALNFGRIDNGTLFAILAMMKNLLLAIILAVSVTCQASPLIYRMNLNQTRTGSGTVVKTRFIGYLIDNYEPGVTNQIAFVLGDKSTKRYQVYYPSQWEGGQIISTRKTLSFVQVMGNEDFSGLRIKGSNTATDFRDGTKIPKTMKLSGSMMFTLPPENLYHIDEFSGNAIYDKKSTETFYEMNLSFDAAIGMVETSMLGKGYIP